MRAASADIALQELHDFFGAWIWVALQQAYAAHDHAGGAVSALKGARVDEGLLHGMKAAVFLKTLNRSDWLSNGGADGNLAGAARLAPNQHGAGAALPFSATIFCAREPEIVSEHIKQGSFGRVMNGIVLTVYLNFDGHGLDRSNPGGRQSGARPRETRQEFESSSLEVSA
jgi:hypothetical protein